MFISIKEKKISDQYLRDGFVIQDVIELDSLNWIRNYYCQIIKQKLPKIKEKEERLFLKEL